MVKILETTLRDGSYVIDFQFTPQDTQSICSQLDHFKFEFIEIGHGLGLGASEKGKGKAYCEDRFYLEAAKKSINQAKWGAFFIPGIGNESHIDMAVESGAHFLRIGCNINELEKALPFIAYAKKQNLIVCANFMKSYAVSADEFAGLSHQAACAGADIVYLVDSAGGMLPSQVEAYFNAVFQKGPLKLGFHGHDNLRLAIANTYKAIECDAYIVDTTLQGMGRGGGNAATETLIALLKTQGEWLDFDLYGLLDFSQQVIKPLLREKGIDDIALISGQNLFHSSFFPKVKYLAKKYGVDPREIIAGLRHVDLIEPNEESMEEIARNSMQKNKIKVASLKYYQPERKTLNEIQNFETIANEARMLAKKYNKQSVCNIVQPLFPKQATQFSAHIQQGRYIIASFEITNLKELTSLLPIIDKYFDIILFDAEHKVKEGKALLTYLQKEARSAKLLCYRDSAVWAKAIEDILIQKKPQLETILLAGCETITQQLQHGFQSLGITVFKFENIIDTQLPFYFDAVIGVANYQVILSLNNLKKFINKETLIIDGGFGSLDEALLHYASENQIEVIRTDMRCAIEAEVSSKLATRELAEKIQGSREIAGIACVAGGVYGKKGAVVLDHVREPHYVIGLADGKGKVLYQLDETDHQKVAEVEAHLFGNK